MPPSADSGDRERELETLLSQALEALAQAKDSAALEEVRIKFLGRKGTLTAQFEHLRSNALGAEEKARFGRKLNDAKRRIEEALQQKRREGGSSAPHASNAPDLTLPGRLPEAGRLHPVTQTIDEITSIFRSIGFSVVDGPELETDHNNFTALNFPADHPSRDGFDTFYLAKDPPRWSEDGTPLLLRTHTSPVQIRFMKRRKPPFMIIVPGRVFRRDAVDAAHCFQFHQVEGLTVGPGINFGDLKGVLDFWTKRMFGPSSRLRFRPHYFPFTEPSAEADLSCVFCNAQGCRVCGQKGWLEMLGCGMVHPNVFKAVGYPPGTTGFAFGMGVERIAMFRYGIEDIRHFFENDVRLLSQFP